jgi:hypothetical protein
VVGQPAPPPPQYVPQLGYALAPIGQMAIAPWRCIGCGYAGQAILINKVSTAGWITFAALLLFCFPLFWIGLLIREPHPRCPHCGTTY